MRPGAIIACVALCLALTATRATAQRSEEQALFFIGKPATVEAGQMVESAIVIGDDLIVAGHVDGVAAAIGGDLRVLPGAQIDGATVVVGGELHVDPGAVIDGPRVVAEGGDFQSVAGNLSELGAQSQRGRSHVGSIVRVAQMLALFVFSIFLVGLAPRHVQNVRSALLRRSMAAGWIGFGTLLGTIPLCVMLAISLVGIPLVPAVLVAFLMVCVLGLTGVTAAVGYALPFIKDRNNLLGAVTLGSVLLTLAAAVPVLGGFVLLIASSFGIGAVLLSRFGTRGSDLIDAPAGPHPAHQGAAA